jgi:GntR family transcriptional regulator/MocR family aminotransferase
VIQIPQNTQTGAQLSQNDSLNQQEWIAGQMRSGTPNSETDRKTFEAKPYSSEDRTKHPYLQVRETLKYQIESGRYKFGEKLPSIRDLSASFKLSHPTVMRAIEQLISQGYIEAISGRGTFVRYSKTNFHDTTNSGTPGEINNGDLIGSLSTFGRAVSQQRSLNSVNTAHALSASQNVPRQSAIVPSTDFGSPGFEHLPVNTWHQCLLKQMRASELSRFPYITDWKGNLQLRSAIATYLRRARGIFCEPEQIIITSGMQQSLALIARAVLEHGDSVAVEDPSSPAITECLTMLNAEVESIPLTDSGVSTIALRATQAKMAIVSPRNNPTGKTLSPGTIYELLAWSDETESFLVEDCFDNDFHYAGPAPEAIFGQRKSERVIAMGSFAKLLYPLTTTNFLVVPKWMSSIFENARALLGGAHNQIEQLALADFIDSGQLELLFRRNRKAYATKRALLIASITQCLKGRVTVSSTCGMHLVVKVSKPGHVEQAAAKVGLPLKSTLPFYSSAPDGHEYIIGFTCMKDSEIFQIITAFANELA